MLLMPLWNIRGRLQRLVRTGALQMAMVPVSVPEGYNRDFAMVPDFVLFTIIRHSFCRQQKREYLIHYLKQQKKFNFEVVSLYTFWSRVIYRYADFDSGGSLW